MTFADRASEHRKRAALALQGRRWSEAQHELEALLIIEPQDAIAWNNLGVTLEQQHKEREAMGAYAKAANLMPSSRLPASNLISGMQRYLGFAAAVVLFKVIEVLLHLAPLSDDARTILTVVAVGLLVLGAVVYYLRQRERLPEETWRAYKSEMSRTRQLRYGGIAFVFVGFLVFAVVLIALVLVPGTAGDGVVVLVIIAGLCWLIVARLLWQHVVGPFLAGR